MQTLMEVIEAARAKCEPASDYELSKRLKVSRSAVSAWRNGKGAPDAVRCAKLDEMTGFPLTRVIGIVGETRAISREEKAVWRKLANVAATVALAVSALPVWAHASTASASLNAEIHMHYAQLCAG